jgi:hypothetical protein
MAKSDLLAVAFTDLNGNDKYNPGKDTLIAALVDTNNDNAVSVGDTVVWGTYPKIPDGSESGTGGIYTSSDLTVTSVLSVTSASVEVDTAEGTVFWSATPNLEQFATFFSGASSPESNLVDSITLPQADDTIFADPAVPGPGNPNTFVDVSTFQLGDQAFLDVLIL